MVLEKVLSTTKYVVRHSQSVKINHDNLKTLVKRIKHQKPPAWSPLKYHFIGQASETVQYLFILDSLDFTLFPQPFQGQWRIFLGKEKISGFFALSSALKNAIKKYPLLDCRFLKNITTSALREIFRGENEIPLLELRQKILRQNAAILLKNFNGQAVNIVKQANHNAQQLVEILTANFPCLNDTTMYRGKKIHFRKHAQILTGDIWGALKGKGYGRFNDIHKLTCFADYKLPQLLRHFGVLEYAPSLAKKIQQRQYLKSGSMPEVEIRANTIWAIEAIKNELKREGVIFLSCQIDWLLWNMAKRIKMAEPHHQTRTIFY